MPTLYGLGTCDTCKKARKWLHAEKIAHTFIDLRAQPPAAHILLEWAAQRGGFAHLVNKSSTTWRQLPDVRKMPDSDDAWLTLIHECPQLIKRPVIVMDDGRVFQGFSETNFNTLFGMNA